jgi:hypothetical protein
MNLPKDFAFTDYQPYDFANRRHIGPSPTEMEAMLKVIGYDSLDALIDDTVPKSIRQTKALEWGAPMTEREALDKLADRPGLLRHHHAAGHPAQHPGKPGLVHRVYALPAGNQPGAPRGALELPDHGLRPDRPRRGECLAA